jgi:hypothetical protein
MHARYYNTLVGRFLSTDKASSWYLVEPQSWNRYGYARNNPLKYIDPDGTTYQSTGPLPEDAPWWQHALDAALGDPLLGFGPAGLATGAERTGAALAAESLDSIATNPKLGNIVRGLFKPTDTRPGGTSGALAEELASLGTKKVGGVSHLTKAAEALRSLEKLLHGGKLYAVDRRLAQALQRDLARTLNPLFEHLGISLDDFLKIAKGSASVKPRK